MPNLMKCGGVRKFVVFKEADIELLPDTARDRVRDGLRFTDIVLAQVRHHTGRNPRPEYIVINTDEPYINEIIDVLKRHGHWGTATPAQEGGG
jgi:hypothetical protein